MPFEDIVIDETAARKIADWARLSKEAIGTTRTATETTHRELWAGSPTPEALAAALGSYGQEAVAKHRAAVLFLAIVAAAEAGSTVIAEAVTAAATILLQGVGTESAIPGANAAAAVIAGLSPLRTIIPGDNGTITIAPAPDPE